MTKEELQKTHPVYETFKDQWTFFVRSYFGGERYRKGNYLLQHPFESDATYKRRKQIAYFYNFCAPVVDIFVSLLYKVPPERNFGSLENDPLFEDFRNDADLEGNTFDEFIREAQRYASIYGRISVIVDKPAMEAITQAEATEQGIRPYLNLITPENITNWTFVRLENGKVVLDSVHIVEQWGKDNKPEIVRVWTRVGWELFNLKDTEDSKGDIIPIDFGTHGLGVVPLVNFYNKNAITRMSGISDLEDIADINKNIYYLCSDAKEIIENTAFPMLAMPHEKGSEDKKTVGPTNIVGFDPAEPNAKPFWLEAPHSSLPQIHTERSDNIQQIFKIANLSGIKSSGDGKQPWSGIALEIENQQRNAVLSEKADNAEQFENKVLTLWALWEGKEFDGSSTYKDNFSIKDTGQNTRNIIDTMRDLSENLAPEFNKELQKRLAASTLPDLPKERKEAVNDSIDSQPQNTQGGNEDE